MEGYGFRLILMFHARQESFSPYRDTQFFLDFPLQAFLKGLIAFPLSPGEFPEPCKMAPFAPLGNPFLGHLPEVETLESRIIIESFFENFKNVVPQKIARMVDTIVK
jgi:hypothetical protein